MNILYHSCCKFLKLQTNGMEQGNNFSWPSIEVITIHRYTMHITGWRKVIRTSTRTLSTPVDDILLSVRQDEY